MRRIIPRELASRIDKGLLAFPVTHFDEQGESVKGHDREHIAGLVENDPTALFAADIELEIRRLESPRDLIAGSNA